MAPRPPVDSPPGMISQVPEKSQDTLRLTNEGGTSQALKVTRQVALREVPEPCSQARGSLELGKMEAMIIQHTEILALSREGCGTEARGPPTWSQTLVSRSLL